MKYFFLAFLLSITACKSKKVINATKSVHEVLVLLDEGVVERDAKTLWVDEKIEVISALRTSRSKNQWILKVNATQEDLTRYIKELDAHAGVLSVSLPDGELQRDTQSNQKKETSSPFQDKEILILLKKDTTPDKLEPLRKYKILSSSRSSRSQNQWTLKLKLSNSQVARLLEDLKKDPKVTSATLAPSADQN